MKDKHYQGYRSFEYLEAGVDYRHYPLARQVGRVAESRYPVDAEQEARVQKLFDDNLVISLHDHCFVAPEDLSSFMEFRRQGRDWTGYEGLARSGLDVVLDNMMDGTAMVTSRAGWKWDDVVFDIGMRLSDIAHQDMVFLATTTDDLVYARENGKIAFVVSIEGAAMIENELDRLDVLYGLGVRVIGIAYSEGNALGAGLKEPRDGGLTVFGRQAVRRMNKLGMAVDVSHSGDRTALDTIEVSEKPVFITHAGARALWNSNRLKPDEVIRACAEKGGVIGIEAAPHTTITEKQPRHSIESFMEHFEYCVDLVGIDHVAFGPDALFGDHVGLHHALAEQLSIGASRGKRPYPEVAYVEGLENPGETFPNIVRWLVSHGYSDEDIAKAIGGNVFRVLKQVWYR
ncbi:MAG TPA: membrane dipeptidase [Trueperaceae bacterium]|nr:membrane dipeptidase [Trueperaceae bacterium]